MSNEHTVTDPRVFEIYKLAVEMADRVSARRATTNAFFVTLNTAFITVAGLFRPVSDLHFYLFSVLLVSLVANLCWWVLLRTYRKLNTAKFAVINKIEADHLPIKIYSDEWAKIKEDDTGGGKWSSVKLRFSELGDIERKIPLIFGVLYIVLL